jgi:hypothetical protein
MTKIKLRCFVDAHYKPLCQKEKILQLAQNNIQFSV